MLGRYPSAGTLTTIGNPTTATGVRRRGEEMKVVEQRRLGSQGLVVSAEGLGCMGMSEFYGATDEDESRSPRSTARSSWASTSSTPPTCTARSRTRSWSAAPSRAAATEVVLATKFGNVRERGRQLVGRQRPARTTCARPATPRCARLGVDHIDLYYQHRVDPERADRGHRRRHGRAGARGQGALPRPLRGGAGDVRRAHAVHPITALQTEYSLWTRRAGGRDPAHRAASWASASWPTARWAAAS